MAPLGFPADVLASIRTPVEPWAVIAKGRRRSQSSRFRERPARGRGVVSAGGEQKTVIEAMQL